MTLRRQLVLSIVAITTLLAIVIGAVSVIILQSVLLAQLDQQVASSLGRATAQSDSMPALQIPSGGDSRGRGQAEGTITTYSAGGQALTLLVRHDGGLEQLASDSPATQILRDVDAPTRAKSVTLPGSLGRYRTESGTAAVPAGNGAFVTLHVTVGLPLDVVTTPVKKLILGIAISALGAMLISVFFATFAVKYALRPLQRVAETASRVADMPLDRGDVALDARVPERDTDPRTEVGQVGAAMNRMLGHVSRALTARQKSEQKVRQFVADASHELRTPLASVRGYAELTRRMGKDLPEDVVYAMSRIESESVRMTSLVEELLLLARLDEGTEISSQDVDLTRIVLDAAHDASVQDPDRRHVVNVPDNPVTVQGDPMRLHQVVANLLGNARTHTPLGTEISVSLERDSTSRQAVMTVADDGPGIDPAVLPVIFERFARGDSSRSRQAGSTGLGLAIVQAIIGAHGGTVAAENQSPGAAFTIRLPLESSPTDMAAASWA